MHKLPSNSFCQLFFFCCLISLKSKEERKPLIEEEMLQQFPNVKPVLTRGLKESWTAKNFHTKGQMTDEKYFRDSLKMPTLWPQGDDCRVQSVLQSRTLWNRITYMSTFCWVGCKQIGVKLNSPHPAWPTSSTRLMFLKRYTPGL